MALPTLNTSQRTHAKPVAASERERRFLKAKRAAYVAVAEENWLSAERQLSALCDDRLFDVRDWVLLATSRFHLTRVETACEAARRALEIDPSSLQAAHVYTVTLVAQNRWAEALPVFQRFATGPARQVFDFVVNHGVTLQQLHRSEEAVPVFLEAMVLQVADPAVHMRLGVALKDMKLFQESAESFLTAYTLEPQRFAAQLMVLHMRQFACQWDGFEASRLGIVEALSRPDSEQDQRGEGAVWALSAIEHPPLLFKRACAQVARKHASTAVPLPARSVSPIGQPLRIGYVSNDFYHHATSLLMVEVLERHDRERFHVTLYSHGVDDNSTMYARVRDACARFVDMGGMSERQMAERIHADGIDILVDLKGHTAGNRLGAFAHRPAPIQAAWLGFPGTCGADYVDYIVGDRWVTPIEDAEDFSERIAQMPHSYQPNDAQRPRPQPTTRAHWGLPEDALVMGCFNQSFKIGPDTFDSWMRILQAVPRSLLWMLDDNPQASRNLRLEAQKRGVDPSRIVFAPRVPVAVHMARLPVADFMVDNWPCNAHTTASDALWMGVPIVTLSGQIFASRVAASLLHAVGLGELACTSVEQYERTVIALLNDRERVQRLRRHLDEGLLGFPLFDSRRFAADLEALYQRMAERARLGLPPDHLVASV